VAALSTPRGMDEAYRGFVTFARERYINKGVTLKGGTLGRNTPPDSASEQNTGGGGVGGTESTGGGDTGGETTGGGGVGGDTGGGEGQWRVQDRSLSDPLRALEKALNTGGGRPKSIEELKALRRCIAARRHS